MSAEMVAYQAECIEAALQQHGTLGRVTGGLATPYFVRFDVALAHHRWNSTTDSLSEKLAAALEVPTCRVVHQGATMAVEVPRERPDLVGFLPLVSGLRAVPPVTAVLGVADDAAPLLIRLPSPGVAHILVAGAPGSGKTALLRTMALSLALRHPRRQTTDHRSRTTDDRGPSSVVCGPSLPEITPIILILIDPRGQAFGDLAGLPQLARPVIVDTAEALEALGSLVRLMERRDLVGVSDPPVVVFLDELADLVTASTGAQRAISMLTRLVQRGLGVGIHVVAATRTPTAAVVGPLLRAVFPVRIVGKVASPEDARAAAGISGTGAERLAGQGDFIAVAEGQIHRFQAAYITPEETSQLVTALRERVPGLQVPGMLEEPEPLPLLAEHLWTGGPTS